MDSNHRNTPIKHASWPLDDRENKSNSTNKPNDQKNDQNGAEQSANVHRTSVVLLKKITVSDSPVSVKGNHSSKRPYPAVSVVSHCPIWSCIH